MKFTVQKKLIDDALGRLYEVATKGLKAEFKMVHRITIKAKSDSIVMLASNGYTDAQCDITGDGYKMGVEGIVTLDATKARDIVRATGQSGDDELEFEKIEKSDSTFLRVRNTSKHKSAKGKKFTWARLPVLSQDHGFTISLPRKSFKHTLKAETLSSAFNAVARYKSPMQYEPKYLVLCIHFLPEETRFICGDGGLFAVLNSPNASTNSAVDEEGEQYVLPAEQSSIVAQIIEGKTDAAVYFKDAQSCCIEVDGLRLLVKGIPDVKYIAYQDHAYNFDKAKAVADIPREELQNALQLMGAVEDKSLREEGLFHSCGLTVGESGEGAFCVLDGSYQGETHLFVNYYKVDGPAGVSEFESKYAHEVLQKAAYAGTGDVVRLFCIDPEGVAIAETINIDTDKSDEDDRVPGAHCPKPIREDKDPTLILFFTSAYDAEENE